MRDWLPWFDGLLEANEDYFAKNGEPLFSSHMLDLSEDPLEENIATCVEYLERMSKSNLLPRDGARHHGRRGGRRRQLGC